MVLLAAGVLALSLGACAKAGHRGGGGTTTTVGGGSTTSSSTPTPTTLSGGGINYSQNPYFPLYVGATWIYRQTSGRSAGETVVDHIVGASGGTVDAQAKVTFDGTTATITSRYVLQPNGAVKLEGAAQAGGTTTGISGSGTYFVPAAGQDCAPCTFTSTETVSGYPFPFTLTETVTSAGVGPISVIDPAVHSAEKLHVVLDVTGGPGGTIHQTTSSDMYLANGVGMVETGNGTASITTAGRTFSSSTGTVELVSYTP